jgi:hypothetical protein
VHRHQLHRVLPGLGLVVAGLQRRMRQEGRQRRHDLAGLGIGAPTAGEPVDALR